MGMTVSMNDYRVHVSVMTIIIMFYRDKVAIFTVFINKFHTGCLNDVTVFINH